MGRCVLCEKDWLDTLPHRTDERWGREAAMWRRDYCPNGLGYWVDNARRELHFWQQSSGHECHLSISKYPRVHLHRKQCLEGTQSDVCRCVSANLFFLIQLATIAVSSFYFSLLLLLSDLSIRRRCNWIVSSPLLFIFAVIFWAR